MPLIHESDLDWSETDEGDARFRRKQLAEAADGDDLGASLYELPPGERSWPYHYHTGNEEAVYVLAGEGLLVLDGDEHAIEPATSPSSRPASPAATASSTTPTSRCATSPSPP